DLPWVLFSRFRDSRKSPCLPPGVPAIPAHRPSRSSSAPAKPRALPREEAARGVRFHPSLRGISPLPPALAPPVGAPRHAPRSKLLVGCLPSFLNPVRFLPASCLQKQKGPTRLDGARGNALSREERGPLRHGRVAWLTASSADHSGGTAADSHGLPRFPCLQICNSSLSRPACRVNQPLTRHSAAGRQR